MFDPDSSHVRRARARRACYNGMMDGDMDQWIHATQELELWLIETGQKSRPSGAQPRNTKWMLIPRGKNGHFSK